MPSLRYIWLGFSFFLGLLWVFIGQNWIFLNLFAGLLGGDGLDLNSYLQSGSSPSFTVLWISCIIALLLWLIVTSRARPRNGAEVRRMRPLWWTAATVLVLLGCLYQLFFTVFIWQLQGQSPVEGSAINYFPVPPTGWLVLILFVVIDVALLFWLPTVLGSPRSYRLVVPGAVKLFGGR
ncbi:MAG: hypothetical protein DCF18_10235 [Cyanobium sp.]|jgi:hypothetical protein|uniref:hypothetical protein n=1 Tax=Synechococcus sp. CS-1333 TaxID=2848638 RepID=UPI000DBBD815|nr:hypothetical protein [Synechococcus sp. CS-1333]MCT0209453.1 hypothetical protein [Synechococcus sp. CS-1333]PZV22245.1 MAG: hypothetical protein DCF18_10235 [Cyanobium sp.]